MIKTIREHTYNIPLSASKVWLQKISFENCSPVINARNNKLTGIYNGREFRAEVPEQHPHFRSDKFRAISDAINAALWLDSVGDCPVEDYRPCVVIPVTGQYGTRSYQLDVGPTNVLAITGGSLVERGRHCFGMDPLRGLYERSLQESEYTYTDFCNNYTRSISVHVGIKTKGQLAGDYVIHHPFNICYGDRCEIIMPQKFVWSGRERGEIINLGITILDEFGEELYIPQDLKASWTPQVEMIEEL